MSLYLVMQIEHYSEDYDQPDLAVLEITSKIINCVHHYRKLVEYLHEENPAFTGVEMMHVDLSPDFYHDKWRLFSPNQNNIGWYPGLPGLLLEDEEDEREEDDNDGEIWVPTIDIATLTFKENYFFYDGFLGMEATQYWESPAVFYNVFEFAVKSAREQGYLK